MADFRKWLIAFAAVALLLSLGTSAYAQSNNAAFNCTANAGVPPIVRAEGITELVGDLILNCNGGNPTAAGAPIPLSNVQIFLNTNVTSRLYAGNLSEGILTIDEPFPSLVNGGGTPVPNTQAPAANQAQAMLACLAINSTNCAITGTAVGGVGGVGASGPYNGTPGRFNIFQGQQNGANSIVWLGVPIDAPGTTGTRIIRITNVRANACQLGVSSTLIPTAITMFIAVNGSQQVTINNPSQTVAFIQPGLIVSNGNLTFVQCLNINGDLLDPTADIGQTGFSPLATFFDPTSNPGISVTAQEGFASSFKVRNYSQLNDNTTVPPTPLGVAGRPPTFVDLQNVLGFPYNTESGFVSTPSTVGGGGAGPFGTANGAIGLADQGTQIQYAINNIGAGVSIFVPNEIALQSVNTTAVTGRAVLLGTAGGAGLTQLTVSGGSVVVTYEVWYSNANIIEFATLPVGVAAISNTGQNLPGLGTSTVSVSFAPVSNVQTASTTAPIPRFCSNATSKNLFSIVACTCNLLFPFVTNQAGFDTGLAIANTSLDPFGTSPQHGTVTLNYYGNTTGGGAAPSPQTSTDVAAGDELVFNLSSGGDHGIVATPGFQGYIISTANFQYCHAFAFVSDLGAQKLADGYLALQLDEGGLERTHLLSEMKSH